MPTRLRMMIAQPGTNRIQEITVAALRRLPGLVLELHPSPGGLTGVQAIQRGEADLAFSGADVAYLAYAGQLEDAPHPFDRLRGIAVLNPSAVHLIAGPQSGIVTIGDLNGRRVSVGGPGSAGAVNSQLILDAFAIHPRERLTIEFNESLQQIIDGSLDAMFVRLPFGDSRISRTIAAGAHLVEISGPPLQRLRRTFPFFKLAWIPAGTYPDQPALHTTGIDLLLLCHRDLGDALVYEITRRFFEGLTTLQSHQGPALDLTSAPATPIPLHDGAVQFYREEELRR
jgi:TRAP transporter TAXI family solute receptor